jgi:UDP-N-acetylglucosamine--N-acetylmuramyl-(pentapeptide) pyrophosphoryl-undecaprenol N-acetylglucosamine transferase
MNDATGKPHIAIACGGTGGHLFPGLAVAGELVARGCRVTLIVSEKEVDRRAVKGVSDMKIVTLPSVGLVRGRMISFALNLWKSVRLTRAQFKKDRPDAVLAMGGFTSAAPIIAGRKCGAACFLHESNTVPGRANRWLSRWADRIFVGFELARNRFKNKKVKRTGTPVRAEFKPVDPAQSRSALGLRSQDPVLLIMGGSQGASGINRLVIAALPRLAKQFPLLQFVHLTGVNDLDQVQSEYHRLGVKALVQLFCSEMNHALGAATLAVSRAGASSLAEIAAVQTPAVLIPFPAAADNHQLSNAKEFTDSGAAILVDQDEMSAPDFEQLIVDLLSQPDRLDSLKKNLQRWHSPDAASLIADALCSTDPVRAKMERRTNRTTTANPAGSTPPLKTVHSVTA